MLWKDTRILISVGGGYFGYKYKGCRAAMLLLILYRRQPVRRQLSGSQPYGAESLDLDTLRCRKCYRRETLMNCSHGLGSNSNSSSTKTASGGHRNSS